MSVMEPEFRLYIAVFRLCTTAKLENACLNESSHAFYSLIQKAWEEKIWRKSSWMTRSPRGRIKPSKSPSKQKIFGEKNTHTQSTQHTKHTHTKHISDLPFFFVFFPVSRTPVPSPHPPFLHLYSSHFPPLCSAHSNDLLKKLSLEVSLLPKYPICAALTPHTHNCICTYTPQTYSRLTSAFTLRLSPDRRLRHTNTNIFFPALHLCISASYCCSLSCVRCSNVHSAALLTQGRDVEIYS